jgi:hypothetical protein
MAGTIIADFIRTDANRLSLNVGNTTFATINAMGLLSNTGVQIISQTGTINAASIAANTIPGTALVQTANTIPRSAMTTGAVLQVIQANTTTAQVFNSGSVNQTLWYDISGLSVTITPISATSKILVQAAVSCAGSADAYNVNLKLVRGSTDVGVSNSYGNGFFGTASMRSHTTYQITTLPIMHLDSPNTTSATTYKVQMNNAGGSSYPTYINRTEDIGNASWRSGCISSITVMEIAG